MRFCLLISSAVALRFSEHPSDYTNFCPDSCKHTCQLDESNKLTVTCFDNCLPKCELQKKEDIKRDHCESECKLMEK